MSKEDTPTTLPLPARLKRRIAAVAKNEGRTAYALMVEILEEGTALAEKRRSFQRDAELADAEAQATNLCYPAEAVFGYIEKLARGQKVHRPDRVAEVTSGYVALYRYDPGLDRVLVLASRHQREAGYRIV